MVVSRERRVHGVGQIMWGVQHSPGASVRRTGDPNAKKFKYIYSELWIINFCTHTTVEVWNVSSKNIKQFRYICVELWKNVCW